MKRLLALGLAVALTGEVFAQSAKPTMQELVIGRDTFFDFGPPFHYFELIRVHARSDGTDVRRVLLTPAGDDCFQTAKAEFSEASLRQSMAQLLDGVDLCAFSEKKVERELKRRNKGLVFSGANIAFQMQCPGGVRILPSAILDRDIYGSRAQTPQFTSWTMQFLSKLDAALGPGAMEKPAFPQLVTDTSAAGPHHEEGVFESDLRNGRYDALYPGTTDHVSAIYAAAQVPAPTPQVQLVRSEPFEPDTFQLPVYPPIAKAARVEWVVSFHLEVGSSCIPEEIAIDDGPKLLTNAVENAVKEWKFCQVPEGQEIRATIAFRLNCPTK